MIDRFVYGTLRLIIMTMITALSATALVCTHAAALRLLSGATGGGITLVLTAAGAAAAAAMLIRHRNDLVDR